MKIWTVVSDILTSKWAESAFLLCGGKPLNVRISWWFWGQRYPRHDWRHLRYIPLTSFSARQHICKCCDISAAQVSDFPPILNYQQPLKYSTPPPHPAKKKEELIKQFIHTKGCLSPFKIWAEMSAHFFPPDRKCYEASPNIILLLMYSVILL